MAEMLGVSQSSIDRYERNTARPTVENFLVYADYFFDVSLDYILGWCEEPDLKLFVDMCFDPAFPISERLKEMLTTMLEEAEKAK